MPIGLQPNVTPVELVIGGWGNYRSVIRRRPQGEDAGAVDSWDPVVSYDYSNIEYWMDWSESRIRFGRVCAVGS
jgi:hypothetical protein